MSRISVVIGALNELTFSEMMRIAEAISDSYQGTAANYPSDVRMAQALQSFADTFEVLEVE